jgi:hypothetical protein
MPALAIGGIVSGIGSIVGGAMGSSAAGKAADAQSAAAQQASQLAGAAGDKALGIQQDADKAAQSQIAPYTDAGLQGLNALLYGTGVGGTANGSGVAQGSLLTPYGKTFTAPTGLDEQNDPGYQARLKLGTDAIQRSAAARGGVVTGGTAKALDSYAQDYASNEYNNVYNRALQDYTTNYNAYNTDQSNQYNRLLGLATSGQQAAGTAATLGQNAANSQAGTITGTAATQGQDLTNAANATASGYINSANAWNGALNGVSGNLTNLALLSQLQNGSGYGSSGSTLSSPYTGAGYADGAYGGNWMNSLNSPAPTLSNLRMLATTPTF